MLAAETLGVNIFLITFNQCNILYLSRTEIVIENKVSVIGSHLYIGSHVPHFQCLQANLTLINLFFPTDARHYQQYSHTNTVTNYHYISLPAINKTFLEMLRTYFCCFSLVNGLGAMLLKDSQKLTAITSCYTAIHQPSQTNLM